MQRSSHQGMDLYRLQADDISAGVSHEVTQQNIKFVDAGLQRVVSAPPIGGFAPNQDDGNRLGDFMSRPVLINSFTWSETNTTVPQTSFNPWKLYFNDVSIKKKLENYKLLRCKMKLKFVVNASPFFYGAMRVSYCPMDSDQDSYITTGDQIKLSQTPGLFLEPANMTSSEMELPFLWPNPWLDITDVREFDNMGRIRYILYSKLRSANGVANASVRISCYAWTTDLELAGLTSAFALQASDQPFMSSMMAKVPTMLAPTGTSDEYSEPGAISGPATAVANVAGAFKNVPVVGGLATAAEVGANMVSGVAKLFGFSNPPVVSDVMPYQPKAFHAFSNVDTSVPSDKLAVDPKNEITLDGSVTGAGVEDSLAMRSLLGRESFVQGSLWQGADAEGKILWTMPVTPIVVASNSVVSTTVLNHTVTGYVGRMFSQWRGAITYKFKLIKSRYHTGRLIITWDPDGVPSTDYETTTLVRVVDLQHEEEVVVTIPFKQAHAWCTTGTFLNNFSNGAVPTVTVDPNAHNGVISVRVLTTLTGPSVSPEIDILCFMQGGDDLEFAVPNELPGNLSAYTIQSEDVTESLITDSAGADEDNTVCIVTVGERVASLRPLLHRTSFLEIQPLGNPKTADATFVPTGNQNCVNYFWRVPRGYGYTDDGLYWAQKTLAVGNAAFNFVTVHPLSWVMNLFAGYRGGIVHHFNIQDAGLGPITYFAAERDGRDPILNPFINARNRFTTNTAPGNGSSMARQAITTTSSVGRRSRGARGMSVTNCLTQSALSVVSPQYSRWRFRPAFEPVRDVYPSTGSPEDESIRVDATFRCAAPTANDSAWPSIEHYVAAASDFDLIFFVCTPTLYVVDVPNAVDTYTP